MDQRAPPGAASGMDLPTFLYHLRRSGLIPEAELQSLLAQIPDSDPNAVAAALVARGKLTRFQAALLLLGKSRGFLLGQYRILDRIGSGGMGTVYKALHVPMDRIVAIKVLKPDRFRDSDAVRWFASEVKAAARLQHPHIVTAYDANEVQGIRFLVMEYVDGPNLDRLVRRLGPLAIEWACTFVAQAALALQYGYERGIIHRDIKPSNLLIANGRQWLRHSPEAPAPVPYVKILDFGLASLTKGASQTAPATTLEERVAAGSLLGTPDYMAPEQARDFDSADVRSDLYSLGCTLFFALTGQPPFPGGTVLEKLVRHATEPAPDVRQWRPEVPAELAHIVSRLLAKNPEERLQTPGELAAALGPWCCSSGAGLSTPVHLTMTTPVGSEPELGAGWDVAHEVPAGSAFPFASDPLLNLREFKQQTRTQQTLVLSLVGAAVVLAVVLLLWFLFRL